MPSQASTARHPVLLSVASTSSSVSYVATVQPHPLPYFATVQPHLIFLMLLQPRLCCFYLILYYSVAQPYPLFLCCSTLSSFTLCCSTLSSITLCGYNLIRYYSLLLQSYPLSLMLLQPHPLFRMLRTGFEVFQPVSRVQKF